MCGFCIKKKLPENGCIYSPERGKRGIKNQYVPENTYKYRKEK
jgi:hypothetical protein